MILLSVAGRWLAAVDVAARSGFQGARIDVESVDQRLLFVGVRVHNKTEEGAADVLEDDEVRDPAGGWA